MQGSPLYKHRRPMWSIKLLNGQLRLNSTHISRNLSAVKFVRGLHTSVVACAHCKPDIANHFTVTTPLYYVNAIPHMGSAYPTIAADVLARYHRLAGKRVHFLTGTDEHGEKIALAAERNGLGPKEHCDMIASAYKQLWENLDISYDSFIRTTDPRHEKLVSTVLNTVWDKGDIYSADYEGLYCIDCEEYKDEGDLEGPDNLCPTHKRPCTLRKEKNYFFALSKYQKDVEKLLESDNGYFVAPDSRRNEVLGWVKEGLRDFSISRAAVSWGIPVPKDPEQTVYVWFDALLGYISGLLLEGSDPSNPEATLSSGWPATVHIIGKDILRFHAVYWPAMLLSAGLPLPGRVFGHGFLTKDGLKMGKSLGNVLDPVALVDTYGSDAVRYFFMKEIPFGQDGDFSEERFRHIVNAGLANDLGNLLNRSLNLLKKNCGSVIPRSAVQAPVGSVLKEAAATAIAAVGTAYEKMKFHEAADAALALSSRGNRYLEEIAPWTAFKSGTDEEKQQAAAALADVLEAVRIVAVLLQPVTPSLSKRVYLQLGYSEVEYKALTWHDAQWGGLVANHATPAPKPVFVRLEEDMALKVL